MGVVWGSNTITRCLFISVRLRRPPAGSVVTIAGVECTPDSELVWRDGPHDRRPAHAVGAMFARAELAQRRHWRRGPHTTQS
jgi:hypothetical protein